MRKFRRYHHSPLYQVLDVLKDVPTGSLETINPFTLAPWEERAQTATDGSTAEWMGTGWAIRVAVSSSARNGLVGAGGATEIRASAKSDPRTEMLTSTTGPRSEHNRYSGELAAMASALDLLPSPRYRSILLLTRNKAAALVLKQPQQQSGQIYTRRIYESIRALRRNGNMITILWLPSNEENGVLSLAKNQAKMATRQGATPHTQLHGMRSTTLNVTRSKRGTTESLPDKVGRHSKRIDAALPGEHTRQLYDRLSWKEASVLAQLRTGMARLNAYLYRIQATPSDQCVCGRSRETVEHFPFRCTQWTAYRTEMLQCIDTDRSNISFYLGGKAPSDDRNWTPNMEAVRATIRFAIATGRLNADRP